MQRPSCTVHHAHLHLSASFSFLLQVSGSKLSIFFSVFFHQLLIFFRWKHFSLGAWQETTEFCDTSMLHIVMNIFICLLQVLLSYDQLCYQAKQIMSMCTWMVYMHKCFAVDSWIQPVTSVSIVFHSETGQQGFSGGYAPNPHTSLPLPLPLFFLVFTGTGFWQTLCRPACCLKRTHLLPQSCHCCCSDALRKNVSCWVGERIALVAGDTLSLTSLDGHEFSRDQKLHPPKPTPPQTCLVVKTMQCNSPWTCFLSRSIRSFQFPFSHNSLTQNFPWRLRKSRCWLCALYFMALLHQE